MARRYLHFTDQEGAKAISESGELWQGSFGPKGAVFAVAEGASFVPQVQMTTLGRAKSRNAVVVFTTDFLPDYAMPEEVMWHMDSLPINVLEVTTPSVAKKMLTGTIPEDPETDMLQIPLHPAFNDWGEWTRMPEDFEPWVPGKDNEKYYAARQLWIEERDVDGLRELWNDKIVRESKRIKFLIRNYINDVLK